MQRIKILGGRINWRQWRKVVELVGRYSPRTPIHITTRQDIEMHDVGGSDIKTIQKELGDVGLTTRDAGGDTVRNITVCPDCNCAAGSEGVFAAARFVNDCLTARSFNLPRKFKISFSGCEQAGDRENRHRARFRHVREKLGDKQFKAQLSERFNRIHLAEDWPDVPLTALNRNARLLWRLQLPNGNIAGDEALRLADAAEPRDAELRINLEHGLELYGSQTFQLPDNLTVLENLPIITACPGLSSCTKAITDTWAVADTIRQRIAHIHRPDLRISISGCPNSCAHSAVADIGLIGLRRNRNGQSAECYRILTGGHNGIDGCLAKGDDVIFAEDVPAVVEGILSLK